MPPLLGIWHFLGPSSERLLLKRATYHQLELAYLMGHRLVIARCVRNSTVEGGKRGVMVGSIARFGEHLC